MFGTQATTRSPATTPSARMAAAVAETLTRSSAHVVSLRAPFSRIETIATVSASP